VPKLSANRAGSWTFVALAVVLLPVMVGLSVDFGVTWDEGARHRNGERVWRYLNGERDSSLFERGGRVYGGLFDVTAVAAERYLTADRFVVRHGLNAMFGWAGVVFSGALAARLFGIWAGSLAMVLLAGSPRYFADSMNNPKDLPYAAASAGTLYAMSTLAPVFPYISRGTAFGIILAFAAALNIRPAAVVNFGFLALLLAAFLVRDRTTDWRRLGATALRFAILVVATLLAGTALWPWAQQAPLTRPFQALFLASEFPWAGQVLFEGRNYAAPDLPWYYPWRWLLISTPPVVLLGVLFAAFPTSRGWMLRRLALAFVAIFPISLIVLKDSTLYDGVRHLLFIYPAIVVLASSGWMAFLSTGRAPWLRAAAAVLLAAGVINILSFQVRSHPNQTVYFNELAGGPRGAFGQFELDYWGNCVLQAVGWTAERARREGRTVTVTGWPAHLVELNARRFPELDFNRRAQDFVIRLNRGRHRAVLDFARRSDTLHRVETPDGAVLCAVFPGSKYGESEPDSTSPDETAREPEP
jgi:hypothetical protein